MSEPLSAARGERIGVLIPDGSSALALPVARCLAAVRGVEVWLLVDGELTPPSRTRHKRGVVWRGRGSFVEEVLASARATGAQVLLPVSDVGFGQLASHRAELADHLRCAAVADSATLARTRDKAALAEFAARHDLPMPRTVVVDPEAGPCADYSGLRFPVLMKPAFSTAGLGIRQFDDPRELARFLAGPRESSRVIIQEYITGQDVGCNVFCRDGEILAHTMQHALMPGRNRFAPARAVEFRSDARVLAAVGQVMRALRFEGMANCDLRIDAATGGAKLLEINARFWGSVLSSHMAGVNFPALVVQAALGRPLPLLRPRACHIYSAPAALWTARKSLRPLLCHSDLWFRVRDPLPEIAAAYERWIQRRPLQPPPCYQPDFSTRLAGP